MDPNSMTYDKWATIDDGSCQYGGSISVYRRITGNKNDLIELWKDTANGKGLQFEGSWGYNLLPDKNYGCGQKGGMNFGLPLGTWTYQFKKKLANGQRIELTQPRTVNVYNKYCDTVGVN